MRIRTRMGSCMLSLLTDYRLVHSSLRLLRPTHTMSSTPSHSGSSREPSPKLDQTSLGEHTKRSQGNHPPGISKKLFVNSWVASQVTPPVSDPEELEAEADESTSTSRPSIPTIVLTDADAPVEVDEKETEAIVISQGQKGFGKGRSETAQQRHSVPAIRAPRKPMTMTVQPIPEEPEDEKALEEKETSQDKNLKTFRSAAIQLNIRTGLTDDPVKQQPSRQRAKSYPAHAEQAVQPLIELPHRISQESRTQVHEPEKPPEKNETKVSKFAQMALMAKKWKKRSDSTTEDPSAESSAESTLTRQRKRPFVEVPRALKLEVLEDAYPIVQRTSQLYKSYLGPKHQLSVLAEEHLRKLNVQLGKKS